MDAVSSLHPTDQTLSSYGLGRLDDRSAAAVHKHLEQCVACRKRVAEMPADSFLDRVRGTQKPSSNSNTGPVLMSADNSLDREGIAPAAPPAGTLPPGLEDHLDYEIKTELGRGGMGVVYLAHNRLMGRDEVFKVMGRQIMERPGVLDRFLREIRAVARLRHDNIVTAYSAFRSGECIIFAMEYVEGFDLSRLVKGRGPLPVSRACLFAHQTAMGLQHAHEAGMVHRDIKPANLMLAREGDKAIVKVLDFGLAKATSEAQVEHHLTQQGQMLGTPDYMAPEQWTDAQSADIRADIYSLGCTLYYLLSGGPPFRGKTIYDIFQAHHSSDAKPLNLSRPEVPMELAALVAKMMAKEPDRRFQTPKDMAEALAPFFKKGSMAFKGPNADLSRAELSQFPSPPPNVFNEPPQPTTDSKLAPAPAKPDGKSGTEAAWESPVESGETEPSSEPEPEGVAERNRRWVWPSVAAGALIFGLAAAWLSGVIRFKTDNGVLLVENFSAERGDLFIDSVKQTLTIKTPDGDYEFSVPSGKHAIEVKKGSQTITVKEVTIEAASKTPVRVSLKPGDPAGGSYTGTTTSGRSQTMVGEVPVPRPHVQPVMSRFARNDVEDWYTRNQDGSRDATKSFGIDSLGANAWLVATDQRNRKEWGWHAPKKFHGDHSDKFGYFLRFNIFTTVSNSPSSDWYVRLTGGGKILFVDGATLARPVALKWKPYLIRLDASGGWKVFRKGGQSAKATDDDVKQVLSNVTDLRIKGEYGTGNLGCLDNVVFGAGA